nr:type II toxin-antitoxin system RelE/ParE family toxin [Candidatus Njordarchaeota archaeon]
MKKSPRHRVVLTRRALKDFESIEKETRKRIAAKLQEYAEEPLKYAQKLINQKMGSYRFRIGDYRVIFDIDAGNIVILRIGHRKSIYK